MCKWLVPFIIVPLIIPVSFFSLPQKIQAQAPVPVGDLVNAPTHIENAVQNTIKAAKEYVLDNLVTVLAKTLIRQISQSTINWINSGFKGSPSFIQNPEQFFTGIADQVAGNFIESIGLGFLCEPFRLNLQLSLALQYGGQGSDTDIGCTFSDVLGNVEGFVEGDFTQGGWDGWFKITQNRNGNPYGSYIQAKTALDIKIATAQGTETLKLDWGKGFQSLTDSLGNILTPGATIEAQLSEVLGTDLRQLELADEINEIMGALVGQLIGQVMSATGLAGSPSSSSGYNPSYAYQTNQEIDPDFTDSITSAQAEYDSIIQDSEAAVEQNNNNINFGTNNDTSETGLFNIALRSQETNQSGTFESYFSEKAVDGSTSGNINNVGDRGSVSLTDVALNPWWNVNLRNDPTDSQNPAKPWALGKVEIFPRTSDVTNVNALGDFRIFVSDTPFDCSLVRISNAYPCTITVNGIATGFNPATQPTGFSNGVFATAPLRMPPTGPFSIDLNISGKFVHIQRIDATSNSTLGIPGRGQQRIHLAEVKIFRNNAPVITLSGSNRITLRVGEVYTEEGAVTFDQSDAEKGLSAGVVPVTISGTVNTNTIGQYTITYTAVDSGGAVAKKTRQINVIENTN